PAPEERRVQLVRRPPGLLEQDEVRSRRMNSHAELAQRAAHPIALRDHELRAFRDQLRAGDERTRDQAGGRAQVVRELHLAQLGAERGSSEHAACPQTRGGERLREGAEEHQPGMAREERREILSAEVAIGLVDSEQAWQLPGERGGVLERQGRAGGIVRRSEQDKLGAIRRPDELLVAEPDLTLAVAPWTGHDTSGARSVRQLCV